MEIIAAVIKKNHKHCFESIFCIQCFFFFTYKTVRFHYQIKMVSYSINRNNQRLWMITLHPYQNCNVTFSVLQNCLFKETDLFDQITFESKSVCWADKQVDLVFVECVWLVIAKVTALPQSLCLFTSHHKLMQNTIVHSSKNMLLSDSPVSCQMFTALPRKWLFCLWCSIKIIDFR